MPDQNQNISVQIMSHSTEKLLTSLFAAAVLLSAYEHCHGHLLDNSLPANPTIKILRKSSLWGSAHVDYWQINQHNILLISNVKAAELSEKKTSGLCLPEWTIYNFAAILTV